MKSANLSTVWLSEVLWLSLPEELALVVVGVEGNLRAWAYLVLRWTVGVIDYDGFEGSLAGF